MNFVNQFPLVTLDRETSLRGGSSCDRCRPRGGHVSAGVDADPGERAVAAGVILGGESDGAIDQ